jgi:DNA modification methylase
MLATPFGQLFNLDCMDWMIDQPDQSVDCCITSPPYWGLRNYVSGEQIGHEATPQDYIAKLTDVFRELYRILNRRGSLWLNLGDNYYGGPPVTQPKDTKGVQREFLSEIRCETCGEPFSGKATRRFCSAKCGGSLNRKRQGFERPKCMLGLPWRVAISLVEDGWILRNDVIWHKPNARPAPFQDRLSMTHEHLFHFVKQGNYVGKTYDGAYYYDLAAMRVEAANGSDKNIGDVWSINTKPLKQRHFAAFPPELIRRPILATVPVNGVIYDPFMGSGTVAVVAEQLGRRWLGTELNSAYCDIVCERLTAAL